MGLFCLDLTNIRKKTKRVAYNRPWVGSWYFFERLSFVVMDVCVTLMVLLGIRNCDGTPATFYHLTQPFICGTVYYWFYA